MRPRQASKDSAITDPAVPDTASPSNKHGDIAATPVADTGAGPLRPSITADPTPTAASDAAPASAAAPTAETAPKAPETADAPQPATSPSPVALPAVPVPPVKPAEIAHTAPKTPISIFVSGKEKKIYVRQDFMPLFSAPVTIDRPEQHLGTHVFTALSLLDDHSHFRWNVISMPGDQYRAGTKTLARIADEERPSRGRQRNEPREAAESQPSLQSAKEALARIEIPQDVIDRISDLMVPGSSLVISDQGLGGETGEGTDFIVVMR